MDWLANGIDDADEPLSLTQALVDARNRPWCYRLADDVREAYQFAFDALTEGNRCGRFYHHAARALALDAEARKQHGRQHTA
jgi:hypothetical protein